jgi:hypothetical protein
LSSLRNARFGPHFLNEILVPLVVGSLNTTGFPLFTLKFALFVLIKLIPTIAKLGLLEAFGDLLFSKA